MLYTGTTRWTLLLTTVLLAAGPAALAQDNRQAEAFSDQAVKQAIDKGVAYLLKAQRGPSWPALDHYQCGPTALVVYALMESGMTVKDPAVRKAVEWLADQKTDYVYELALRCMVWEQLAATPGGKYRKLLEQDAQRLIKGTINGAFTYKPNADSPQVWDHSNSQYALLGIWAASRAGVEVPQAFWKLVQQHWKTQQGADGGWGYSASAQSTGTMTAAGIASLLVCFETINTNAFVTCDSPAGEDKHAARGIAWLEGVFGDMAVGKTDVGIGDRYYFLYGCERVALASGYKLFGKVDWYLTGTAAVLQQQGADGSWDGREQPQLSGGPTASTAFALLFLARGRNPIAFNKLQYNGDWNCRPRDLSRLTAWISRTFETTVNWQIISISVPVKDWHDSPILYISGSRTPQFSDEEIDKLRQYVLQGGTIFSSTQCDNPEFMRGIRDAYRRMFPQYNLVLLEGGHELYGQKVQFKVSPKIRFFAIHNGIRPLVIHTDTDLSLAWHSDRTATDKDRFEAAANVFMYCTDKGMLRKRAVRVWPTEPASAPNGSAKVVRVRWKGNWDPEPLALERFARMLTNQTGVRLEVGKPLRAADLAHCDANLAIFSGTGKIRLDPSELAAIKAFVAGGGTVLFDAAGGDAVFAQAAEDVVEKAFGQTLMPLGRDSAVYTIKGLSDGAIDRVRFRRATLRRLVQARDARLRCIMVGDKQSQRPGVLLSREDISNAGLVGYESYSVDGYAPGNEFDGSAYRLMRNVVLTAAGKTDLTPPASESPKK